MTEWLDRAGLPGPIAEHYRAVLAEIRDRGFSVPLHRIAEPVVMDAFARLRSEPLSEEFERQLADALRKTDEMLLSFTGLSDSDEFGFRTIAAPIFDPIGRVLLSLSLTGPERPVRLDRINELGRRLAQSAAIATRQARGRAPNHELPATPGQRRTPRRA